MQIRVYLLYIYIYTNCMCVHMYVQKGFKDRRIDRWIDRYIARTR